MDVKKFCAERIVFCEEVIAGEKLGGNVVKEEHAKGCKMAYQTVILALLEAESTGKSGNKQIDVIALDELELALESFTTNVLHAVCDSEHTLKQFIKYLKAE